MLDMQRRSARLELWLMPIVVVPRVLPARFRKRGMTATLGLLVVAGIAVHHVSGAPPRP